MPQHSHDFVEEYTGLVGYGLDRPTDEATVRVYLQKFSDDACMAAILPRLEQEELGMIFETISDLLRKHMSEEEYHDKFLKDPEPHHHHPIEE
ncbi:MAG: cytoplasmic protein [Desulfarculaceae bacterium]|nr:cytoplasmic protein [Desulfarculaceae bacterium]MCF8072549.1 cytoplasmic protein [Desulfarculaceae bacterium]MCF8103452.1 cytoplasmic protein [Desulfarculaceae bacterium]MCF8117090.1 cytoplasmic protein [Desulfarculaceae bacterium]